MVFYFCTMKKETLLFGIYPVIEALKAKQTIDKAYVQKGLQSPKIDAIVADLEALNTTISYVPLEKMEKLCRSNHQGIILISSPIEFVALETMVEAVLESKKTPLFLILDQISDVRNFGAILRTAECTGVDGIIIQKSGSAPINGDTIKTSAGAVFNIPICKVDHIKDAIFYFQASEIQVVAATEKTDQMLYDIDFQSATAIVMGSEMCIRDRISDVRNFGAILRTAECTGVDGVIIQKKGGAPVSGDTVKTSAGAIFNIPICKVDHIKDAIYYLQGSGITTIAATEKTHDTIYNLELNEPMAIVMGSEGLGVSKSVLSIVDKKASLPLLGVINSLNVSVACGALLYEVVRQRSK